MDFIIDIKGSNDEIIDISKGKRKTIAKFF